MANTDTERLEKLTISFKRGLRTDGELEAVTIGQHGFGELRLTAKQARSLAKVLTSKFDFIDAAMESEKVKP